MQLKFFFVKDNGLLISRSRYPGYRWAADARIYGERSHGVDFVIPEYLERAGVLGLPTLNISDCHAVDIIVYIEMYLHVYRQATDLTELPKRITQQTIDWNSVCIFIVMSFL